MENEFRDQWALVLGGSSGLGLASAKKLAQHGMNVCIVKTFHLDALKQETISEVIAALPKKSVQLLLHSIAKGSVKPLLGAPEGQLTTEDLTITIHAMGISWFDWTQQLIAADLFTANARNIAFTSEGNTKALKHYGAVSAAKATLEALMRQMAVEYAPLGMSTNCIQAGVTQTKSFQMIPGSEEIAAFAKHRNPYKRLTAASDVANAVYLLARDEGAWINGTVLKVDGGESLR